MRPLLNIAYMPQQLERHPPALPVAVYRCGLRVDPSDHTDPRLQMPIIEAHAIAGPERFARRFGRGHGRRVSWARGTRLDCDIRQLPLLAKHVVENDRMAILQIHHPTTSHREFGRVAAMINKTDSLTHVQPGANVKNAPWIAQQSIKHQAQVIEVDAAGAMEGL